MDETQKERQEDNVDIKDIFIITCKFKDFSKEEASTLAKKTARFISYNIYDTKNRKQKVTFKLRRNNDNLEKADLMYHTEIQLEGSPLTGYLEDERHK